MNFARLRQIRRTFRRSLPPQSTLRRKQNAKRMENRKLNLRQKSKREGRVVGDSNHTFFKSDGSPPPSRHGVGPSFEQTVKSAAKPSKRLFPINGRPTKIGNKPSGKAILVHERRRNEQSTRQRGHVLARARNVPRQLVPRSPRRAMCSE